MLGLLLVACGATLADDEGISPTLPAQPAVNGSAESQDTAVVQDISATSAVPTEGSDPMLATLGYKVGDLTPAFGLPTVEGPSRSMGMFRGEQNIILVFYYAFW